MDISEHREANPLTFLPSSVLPPVTKILSKTGCFYKFEIVGKLTEIDGKEYLEVVSISLQRD